MITMSLTDEEAYLLGQIFQASVHQRQQVADTICATFGDTFDWSRVSLSAKVQDAAGAELCSPYLEELVA